LLLPAPGRGQSAEAVFRPAALAAKGAFFALSVPDLQASVKWYSEKLGLKVAMEVRDNVSVTVLAGGGLIVELIHSDQAVPSAQTAPAAKDAAPLHGFSKAGFFVDDFDRALATLVARKVDIAYGPYPGKENGLKNVILRDNAGNLIQVFGR